MWIKNIHDRSPFSLFIYALFCTMSGNKVMFPISEGNLNFLLCSENLRRDLCWRHCKYKEWMSFFLGSWEMNRSAEQTNRVNRTRFVCSALRFISHEPRKKDTHSLNIAHVHFEPASLQRQMMTVKYNVPLDEVTVHVWVLHSHLTLKYVTKSFKKQTSLFILHWNPGDLWYQRCAKNPKMLESKFG